MLLKFLIRSYSHSLCLRLCLFWVGYGNATVAITYLRVSCVCVCVCVGVGVCVRVSFQCAFLIHRQKVNKRERGGKLSRRGERNGNGTKMHKVYMYIQTQHTHCASLMSQNDSATTDYELIPNRCIQCACLNVCVSVCLCASVRFFVRFVLPRSLFPSTVTRAQQSLLLNSSNWLNTPYSNGKEFGTFYLCIFFSLSVIRFTLKIQKNMYKMISKPFAPHYASSFLPLRC